jgi:hypothetical protein
MLTGGKGGLSGGDLRFSSGVYGRQIVDVPNLGKREFGQRHEMNGLNIVVIGAKGSVVSDHRPAISLA